MDLGKIEYRVRPVTRYIVTRFHEGADGHSGSVETRGEYDSEEVAYQVGYALCKAEHDHIKLPPGDERIIYPKPPIQSAAIGTGGVAASL